jgi:hypothetical protein
MSYRIKATWPGAELTSEWHEELSDACIDFVSQLPRSVQLLTMYYLGVMVGSDEDSDTFEDKLLTIEERLS